MKAPLSFRQPVAAVGLIVALSAISPALNAQDKPRPSAPAQLSQTDQAATPPYALEITQGKILYKGNKVEANLGTIVDILRDNHQDVNIAMLPGLSKIKIPDIKLRAARLEEELQALSIASGSRFVWVKPELRKPIDMARPIDPTTGLPIPPEESSLYILTVDPSVGNPMKPRRSVEVFNLSGYFQQLPKQDEKAVSENVNMLEVVINQTLEQLKPEGFSDEDGPYPDFQFHRGANLFIVIGPPIAIEVARKVVNALPGQQSGGDRIIIDPATGLPIDPATGLPLAAPPAPAAPPPGPKPRY